MNLLSLANEKAVPADDFTPVLVFVLIKANPHGLLSTIQFVESFYGKRLCGEDHYWWTQFSCAVEYIKTMMYSTHSLPRRPSRQCSGSQPRLPSGLPPRSERPPPAGPTSTFLPLPPGAPGEAPPDPLGQILPPTAGALTGALAPQPTYATNFSCPRRPNLGRDGRAITLRANHFQITMPS
ncbi:unnamed protein product, partial [Cyprideis torosa]